ncbi:sigma-54-dependent transcriptional regulator [Vibrio sp. FJH11]
MKRIDSIFQYLLKNNSKQGMTTLDIAEELNLDRANVSGDLNKLCKDGKVIKSGIRPVYYRAVTMGVTEQHIEPDQKPTALEQIQTMCPSLYGAAEQAKAAILYPPNGMHIMLQGETGTGKSMFASLIHKSAIRLNCLTVDAPFVIFNCAEYSNNPQLLVSQLFGCKKGAYTGADSDRPGLLDVADGGILFLDEVHRLPPEGQEMLFTFIDTGLYRRLGEADTKRKSKVLIICATTENPESELLSTFVRRIPMRITLPPLRERSIEERLNLITSFISKESARLQRPIKVSINAVRSLLGYDCPSNIGQLEGDIRILCAKAYADFITGRQTELQISSYNLPDNIKSGLNLYTEHRQIWTHLNCIDQRFYLFTEDNLSNVSDFAMGKTENIYELIDKRVNQLKQIGSTEEQLDKIVASDINNYLGHCIEVAQADHSNKNLEKLAGETTISLVEEISMLCQSQLGNALPDSIKHAMVLHLANLLVRLRNNKRINNPKLTEIKEQYPTQFKVATQCLSIINSTFDVHTPVDEAGFLTMFIAAGNEKLNLASNQVKVIVVHHGESTATSIAATCNQLLGGNYCTGFNMALSDSPSSTYTKIVDFLKGSPSCDVLLLVDMGSLMNFGADIEKELNIKTKTISMTSAPHVLAACGKAMLGYPLDFIYDETLQVTIDNIAMLRNTKTDYKGDDLLSFKEAHNLKLTIITICTTGEGSAIYLKKFLERSLADYAEKINIIPINLVGEENISDRLKLVEQNEFVLCVTGPFKTNLSVPHYDLEHIFSGKGIEDIKYQVEYELGILEGLSITKFEFSKFDKDELIFDIRHLIYRFEKISKKKVSLSLQYGILLHLACTMDSLANNEPLAKYPSTLTSPEISKDIYTSLNQSLNTLGNKYAIKFSKDELFYLYHLFKEDDLS